MLRGFKLATTKITDNKITQEDIQEDKELVPVYKMGAKSKGTLKWYLHLAVHWKLQVRSFHRIWTMGPAARTSWLMFFTKFLAVFFSGPRKGKFAVADRKRPKRWPSQSLLSPDRQSDIFPALIPQAKLHPAEF